MHVKNLRWWIAGLLFFGTALNYIDRSVLSILEPRINLDLRWTEDDWGLITGGFFLAYALFALPAGRLVDKIGTKYGYLLLLSWWGAACTLHGLAGSVAAFVALRFALGMGESGLVPATAKACTEWFPQQERGFAYGMASAGMMIGGIITPPLVGRIAGHYGWPSAFFVTGGLCALWILAWQLLFGNPASHRLITPKERDHILSNRSEKASGNGGRSASARVSVWALLALPQVWGIALARFIADPVWAFYMNWIPKYMKDVRHIAPEQIEDAAWWPFLAAAVACVASGSLSSFLIKRGLFPVKARKVILILGAAVMPASVLTFYVDNYLTAFTFACIAAFGHTFWVVATQTLPTDMFPDKYIGTVTGSAQTVSAIGNALGMCLVGYVVRHVSYEPVFLLAGLLHPIGTVVILLTLRRTDAMKRWLLERERQLETQIA
jgi:MFS transporter, ACS family, hexuronate transporter